MASLGGDLAALEGENGALARAAALISKVVHSRGLRPLPPTPRKSCRRLVSRDASETVLEVALGNPKRPGSASETPGRGCPIPTRVAFADRRIVLGGLEIPTGVAFPAPGAPVQDLQ